MPQKPQVDAGNLQTQAGRRFPDTYHDIHVSARFPLGRPWNGYREYAANPELGHQPGFVNADLSQGDHEQPMTSVWSAPWVPEARYFRFDDQRKRISFAYEVMERDEQMALDRYYEAAAVLSAERGWDEIDPSKAMSFQVRTIIGRAPRMLKIAQAARAGDPWLLGHIDEPNEELARLLNWKVVRLGGMESDRAIGTPIVGRVEEPKAPLSVDQVLTTAPSQLATMIAEIVNATLDARETQKKRDRTQNARDARAANRSKTEAETMSA